MSKNLQFSFYPRSGDRASVVFRKYGQLYRITIIERAALFVQQLDNYQYNLTKGKADNQFIMQIDSPRKRNRVLEIGLKDDDVTLVVYEAMNGFMKPQFKWNGAKDSLNSALKQFSAAIS